MTADELLRMPFGEVLVLLASPRTATDGDPWVDPKCCEVPFREVLDAGRRGEVVLSKVRRKYFVRRSELDRWIETQRFVMNDNDTQSASSSVRHILESHGYKKAGCK